MNCKNNVFHFYELFKVSKFFSLVYSFAFAIAGFIFLIISILAGDGKISGDCTFWISVGPYVYGIFFYIACANLLHFLVFLYFVLKHNIKRDLENMKFATALRLAIIITDIFFLMLNDFMVRRYLRRIIISQDYSKMNRW